MVTAGIFLFKENSHGRAGNRIRDLMINSQILWPLDHEAGPGQNHYYSGDYSDDNTTAGLNKRPYLEWPHDNTGRSTDMPLLREFKQLQGAMVAVK